MKNTNLIAIFILSIDGALISMNILPSPGVGPKTGAGRKNWMIKRTPKRVNDLLVFQFFKIKSDFHFFMAFNVSFREGR